MKANGGPTGAATPLRRTLVKLTLAAIALILTVGCATRGAGEVPPVTERTVGPGGQGSSPTQAAGDGPATAPGESRIPARPEVYSVGYTYAQISGNRYFSGKGRLGPVDLASGPLRIDVPDAIGTPAWLTAARHPGGGVVWVVTGVNGKSVAYRTGQDGAPVEVPVDISAENFTLVPPVLVVGTSGEVVLTSTRESGGLAMLPISARTDTRVEFSDGMLALTLEDSTSRFPADNAPDASFMVGDGSTIYSFARPTGRYPHGAVGDEIEWGEVWGVSVGVDEVGRGVVLDDDDVFEGLYPIVADLDGDGVQEIIGTVSNSASGARLVVFKNDPAGMRVAAESEPIGTRFRWTHQVAVAPFGPNGELELATVRTPHIGGVAEYYRMVGGELVLVASLPGGYSSHIIGSRNLDMALAADFDGDGAVELLVPSRDRQLLVALRRTGGAVEEAWELPLGSPLATNLAGVELPAVPDNSGDPPDTDGPGGRIAVGAVTEAGVLFIWQ